MNLNYLTTNLLFCLLKSENLPCSFPLLKMKMFFQILKFFKDLKQLRETQGSIRLLRKVSGHSGKIS